MIITIASGKGGVGKTNISINLALSLINEGRKICLLDADIGLANVDVLLGLSSQYSLIDYIEDRCPLDKIMVSGPGSLKIIPGGSALERLPSLKSSERTRLENVFKDLNAYDTTIIDVSAGINEQVIHFLAMADLPVLVVIPEPTSLTDAYAVLKTYHQKGHKGLVRILVNQVKSADQGEKLFNKFLTAVKKFLPISITLLGSVVSDPNVTLAVSKQRPFVDLFPETPASQCLRQIAAGLKGDTGRQQKGMRISESLLPENSHAKNDEGASDSEQLEKAEEPPEISSDIAKLLIQEGHITHEQVAYTEKVQSKLDTPKRFLEVLKDLGYISDTDIKETLYKHRTGIRLGSLLVELGHITDKQLSMVLKQQKEDKEHKRLGELLVESNYISEYDLAQVLSMHLGFPYVEVKLDMVDAVLMKKASRQFFTTHNVIPLANEKGSLNMAMADPFNKSALDAIKETFGPDFTISITLEKLIKEVLDTYDEAKANKGRIEADKGEVVELVDRIIFDAVEKRVSDIHIEPMKNRMRVRFRKDGTLIHHMDLPIRLGSPVVSRIKVMANANITEKRRHQDGRILLKSPESGDETDIRVSFYVTLFGEKVVMRLLTKKAELYKINDLGMGSKMLERFREEVLEVPSGVVIVTGPTGAGKTTTLYGAINYCNKVDTCIITAEEPVEYVIEGIAQCPINPKIGVTFEETLKHMMRQDPDIIILGEIRDKLSAESAIQAALTGHKVLTTFHTEDSIGALLRLMNMDIETFLISSTVAGVVAQRLLKKVCPHCKKPYTPTAADLRRLKYAPQALHGAKFQLGSGCERCYYTGYIGRTAVFELLVMNEYVKNAVLGSKTSYEIRRISLETTGLVTLLEDGVAKASQGITSIPEVIRQLPLLEPPRPLEQIYRLIGDV